jgi:hypothetical protein
MTIRHLFTDHPTEVGETYGEHCLVALSFGGGLFKAALACAVHAFLPFLFERTASNIIRELHHRMVMARTCTGAASKLERRVHPG